jgi:hypothetical protein
VSHDGAVLLYLVFVLAIVIAWMSPGPHQHPCITCDRERVQKHLEAVARAHYYHLDPVPDCTKCQEAPKPK